MIISLGKIRDHDLHLVGSKAFGLARMKQIGLKVAPGFCLTATAFREHIESNELTDKIESVLDKLNSATPKERKSILLEIREAIINAPLAVDLRSEIENHYHTLAANRVAVRSSATSEDLPGHSFAGQYETYLGIADLSGCIDAVKKCWASLWTQRAYEYRQKNGFDHMTVDMAVIVQSLVEADASGVIFTADPVNGYKNRIVVETVPGLGDSLVSGKATPLRFVIDKKTLRIISRTISDEKINEELLKVLGDETIIKKLAKQARKAESKFGCPQDIEWAVSGNKIFFLQSRPITTLPSEKSWQDRQIWCSFPAEEILPDVVTPITVSIIQTMVPNFIDPAFRALSIDRRDHPLYGLVSGRLYFNANLYAPLVRRLADIKSYDFRKLAGSNKGLLEVVERLENAADEDLPNISFNRLLFILKIPLMIVGSLANTPQKGRSILARINAKNENWNRLDPRMLSCEQITQNCQEIVADFRNLLGSALYLFSILAAFPIFHALSTKWLRDDGSCANRLLAGLGDMNDAVAGLDLWRLAQKAHEIGEVEKAILSGNDWKATRKKISKIPKGEQFLESWDEFMSRHGHHRRGELELYNPPWSETPDYILKLLQSYIAHLDKTDPIENYNRLRQERQQLEQQCRKKLTNPIKRMIFKYLLVRSQQGSVFRENVKSEVIKLLTALRKILLELGKRLHKRGVLEIRDDIFFLELAEIEPVTQNKADFDIKKTIASRRAEYEKNKSVMPPKVVIGKFNPDDYTLDAVDTNAEVLNGLAVSSGVVTGKARVILKADTDEQVLPGEVLVAPFTDPGWTPYFMPAAAIVMDIGGMLSHGSIIAREYGIPAVVNVGPATKIIKTGQTIQVDADNGTVKILR